MFFSSLCACVGQLFWKIYTNNYSSYIFLLIGIVLYGLGALIMIIAYRFGNLSVLQPLLSMNYVFTIILATLILDEKFTVTKSVGILIIMIGVFLVGGGDDE